MKFVVSHLCCEESSGLNSIEHSNIDISIDSEENKIVNKSRESSGKVVMNVNLESPRRDNPIGQSNINILLEHNEDTIPELPLNSVEPTKQSKLVNLISSITEVDEDSMSTPNTPFENLSFPSIQPIQPVQIDTS